MYALMESTPYEGEWPIAYFKSIEEAQFALHHVYAHDEQRHPNLPQTDWDWGYHVSKVTPKTLDEFMKLYPLRKGDLYEKTTLGGDDCYLGRGLWSGIEFDPNTDIGINVLTNS